MSSLWSRSSWLRKDTGAAGSAASTQRSAPGSATTPINSQRTGPLSTLTITQIDAKTGLRAVLRLVAHQDIAVVRADVEVVNDGVGLLDLTGVSSIVIAPDGTGDTMRPDDVRLCWARSEWMAENRWIDEPVRERLLPDLGLTVPGHDAKGGMTLSSLGSWSTGNFLPTAVLHDTRTGVAIGWQVESSGGWTWEVGERWQGLYVLAQGPDEPGQQWRHRLEPGAAFRTVPAAVAFSDRGRDGAFGELTRHRRTTRRAHPDASDLPVVFNDYMNTLNGNPTTAVLLPLIRAAAAVGAEVFVVDAGWYSDEEYWWDTVGEWQVSGRRFPKGFGEVVDAIRDGGMRPGLWLEPEVVGVRSPAVAALPGDAFLQRGGVPVVESGRLHLDLRHPAARAHLDETVDRLIADFGIAFFKLDYNISALAGTDLDADSPGDGRLQVARAHLDWLTGVLDRHPGLTIESCSSGAMRADHAVLSIAQLQSTSDQQVPKLYPPIAASAPASISSGAGRKLGLPPAGDVDRRDRVHPGDRHAGTAVPVRLPRPDDTGPARPGLRGGAGAPTDPDRDRGRPAGLAARPARLERPARRPRPRRTRWQRAPLGLEPLTLGLAA